MPASVLIETERLQLRPLTSDDIDDLVAIHARPEVERFMGPFARERVTEWLTLVQMDYAEHRRGRLAVTERATGRFLGRSGLKYRPHFAETDVGWVLHPEAWGLGYATEAGRACVQWGFETFDVAELTAMIRPDNQRSIAVAERIGMSASRADVLFAEPVIVYSITRERLPARVAPRGPRPRASILKPPVAIAWRRKSRVGLRRQPLQCLSRSSTRSTKQCPALSQLLPSAPSAFAVHIPRRKYHGNRYR